MAAETPAQPPTAATPSPPTSPPPATATAPSPTDLDPYEPPEGIRQIAGVLLLLGAVFNLAGIFPVYNQGSWSIANSERGSLIVNLGIVATMATVAVISLLASSERSLGWGAMGGTVALGGLAFAMRFGDIASNIADGTSGAWGWWLQSIGDLCALSAGIAALIWLVQAGAATVQGEYSGWVFITGAIGMGVIILSNNSNRIDVTLSGNGRTISHPIGKTFANIGWDSSGELLLLGVGALIVLLAPFALPRIVGVWALAVATIWFGLAEVIAYWSMTWGPQKLDTMGIPATQTADALGGLAATAIGWVGLFIASVVAYFASEDEDGEIFIDEFNERIATLD